MKRELLLELLAPYNPWWTEKTDWRSGLPEYQRPIVRELLADIRDLPQAISITGPRRVGKTTAVRQGIRASRSTPPGFRNRPGSSAG